MVDRPLATILTPISMDHMMYLGDTLEKIAFEKAGIMKAGAPCIVGPQPKEADAVFEKRARALGVALVRAGREYSCVAEGTGGNAGMRFRDANRALHLPRPGLIGDFQIDNAGMALAALPCLGDIDVREDAIRTGLTGVSWPARMQRVTQGRYAQRLPAGWEIWLDGGHNESAGAAIASILRDWQRHDAKPLHLVFGMLNTKQPVDYLRHLAPHVASLQAVAIKGGHQNLTLEEMIAAANQAGIARAEAAGTIEAAFARILETGTAPSRVLFCGSLYFAGEVLAGNG
jgi:dihydrofolate synthase/folylpolyglutamate synthase